jgi:hypothetical protein
MADKLECLDENCKGELKEMSRKSIENYELICYLCKSCAKEYYLPYPIRGRLSIEEQQGRISTTGQT